MGGPGGSSDGVATIQEEVAQGGSDMAGSADDEDRRQLVNLVAQNLGSNWFAH
jgi:hypothetical protein